MTWQGGVAYFFGGMFLANFTSHFIAGVSGRPFPTPFAKSSFRGFSSPAVNILYGLFNLGVAYVLLVVVGGLELRRVADGDPRWQAATFSFEPAQTPAPSPRRRRLPLLIGGGVAALAALAVGLEVRRAPTAPAVLAAPAPADLAPPADLLSLYDLASPPDLAARALASPPKRHLHREKRTEPVAPPPPAPRPEPPPARLPGGVPEKPPY